MQGSTPEKDLRGMDRPMILRQEHILFDYTCTFRGSFDHQLTAIAFLRRGEGDSTQERRYLDAQDELHLRDVMGGHRATMHAARRHRLQV